MLANFFLCLLEYEYFAWCTGEAADADFVELIVFEESLGVLESPSIALEHLLDHFVVPVVAHFAVAGCEYDIPSFFD